MLRIFEEKEEEEESSSIVISVCRFLRFNPEHSVGEMLGDRGRRDRGMCYSEQ